MKHLLLYFYITSFLIFSNCYISNDNIAITNPKNIILMIEGSQIDWGGHDMDSDYIISETLDFDLAISTVLEFAKKR